MRTWLSHSRQLRLRSAAGTIVCDLPRQRDEERCIGHYNRKSEPNCKNTKQHKTLILPVTLVHATCIDIQEVAHASHIAGFRRFNNGHIAVRFDAVFSGTSVKLTSCDGAGRDIGRGGTTALSVRVVDWRRRELWQQALQRRQSSEKNTSARTRGLASSMSER